MNKDRSHPMQVWADRTGVTLKDMATASRVSQTHLINLFAGRKEASLRLAKRLSDLSGGQVPMDAFLARRGEGRQ